MTTYRQDIEGLRAIAVLAVLAFHLDPTFLPGGFQGVDVFFVVSGYVITKLIHSTGADFTFRGFYVRRFWRLFPALCATVGATLLAAYPIYAATDYATLGWSGLATLFGVSNFFFYGQIDYLNDNTLVHPLLHTWSLGVEEQFYLLWPFAVVVLARRIALGWLVAVTLLASFAFNLVMVGIDGQFAFYMAPTRFFEFAAGAAVLIWGSRVPQSLNFALGGLGLVLIAVGFVFVGETYAWPDVYSLLPVGGTGLLLLAGPHPIWRSALGAAPFQFIGRISYALYLVHWPIIVIYRYWRVAPLSTLEIVALGLASLTGAVILHLLIEVPFREGGRPVWHGLAGLDIRNWPMWARLKPGVMVVVAGATLTFAISIAASDGLPHRISRNNDNRLEGTLSYAGDLCDASRASKCQFGDSNGKHVVYVVGDSLAGNLVYGLDKFFIERGIKGVGFFDHGCLFLYGTTHFENGHIDEDCAANVADAYDVLSGIDDPVILAGSLDGYIGSIGPADASSPLDLDSSTYPAYFESRMQEGLEALGADHRPVMLVKQSYSTGIDTARCLSRPGGSLEELLAGECKPKSFAENVRDSSDIDAILDRLSVQFPGVSTIDPKSAVCEHGTCTVMDDGAFFFRDANHLTNEGSEFLIEKWRQQLTNWLETAFAEGGGQQATHQLRD